MARTYHSASSDALGQRCERAWYYAYVVGVREPTVTWDEIVAGAAHTSRQRSTALGTAVHARLEAWYRHEPVAWRDLPGQVALSGLGLLPHADRCAAHVETPIGTVPLPAGEAHAPPTALDVDGVLWAGYRDLVAYAPGECARLGVHAPDGVVLVDHKSSANVQRYALTPAELATNLQANLYAYATCVERDLASVPARWVYYETRAVRRARAVDVTLRADVARVMVAAASARARHLDTLVDEADAVPNPEACGDYGGCPHHISAGGPCNARRSLGALIQARVKKEEPMALTPEMQAKFAALQGGAAPAPTAEALSDTTPAPPPPAEAPAPAPAPRRGRPRTTAAPALEAPPPPAPAGMRTVTIPATGGPLTLTGFAADVLDALLTLGALS